MHLLRKKEKHNKKHKCTTGLCPKTATPIIFYTPLSPSLSEILPNFALNFSD
jgi:hypothetical protein